jgi:subtilisin family serine protease
MKKISLVLLPLLFFIFTFVTQAQTVHYDYQDGLVVFQLKERAKIINTVDAHSRIVDYKNLTLFSGLSSYAIVEVLRLHPDIKDEKLRRTYQIQLQDIYKVDALIKQLKAHPDIEYAELKEFHRKFLTPNDLGANATNTSGTSPTTNQWALHKIMAQQAWDIGTGDANVVVAVTDDAFRMDHVDLVNKYVSPYDAVTQGTNAAPCGTNAGNHGTHVAGTVGAQTNNGIGVASIGFNVSVMPIKIGNCNNQLTHGYEGITYAANNGAHVVNMSWGGGGFSNYGQNVCNYAWNQGTILVAAAGNNNASTVFYPAGYTNVIAVASTTPTDAKSNFSQYGTWINISAPGSNIRSTYATSSTAYNSISGTSMASPHVAGLLGLMKSVAPNATNANLITCLNNGADNINTQNPNFIGQLGVGRINAFNSMVCAAQFAAEHDAAITQILNPGTSLCNGTFSPLVTLRNFGSQNLTSCVINYNWGGANQIFNWTGNLATGSTVNVTLPQVTIPNGNYTFTSFTTLPNGNIDQNPTNDASETALLVDNNGQSVTLNVITDCWGSETTWQVVNDDNNQVVASGGPYADGQPLGSNIHSFCLPTGCYTFTIFDSYGDGMNGAQWQSCSVNGNYFMTYENGTQIFQMTAANGNFGNSAIHPFCIIPQNNFYDAGITTLISPSLFTCSANVAPVVRLRNFGLNTLTSTTITYSINSGASQQFNWTGNLPSGQTIDVILPAISAVNGLANFLASTSLPNGQPDNNTNNDGLSATFAVNGTAASLPFVESFETNVLANGTWKTLNPDNDMTWAAATVGGITPGNQAMKMDFFNYAQAGQRDGLISPKINLDGYVSAEMTFHHAYRRFNQTATDSLIIYVSTNCGSTWTRVFEIAENGQGTFATQTTNENAFTPAQAADWCFQPISSTVSGASCYVINLTPFVGQEIVVMFEAFNAGTLGNNLFLDNININGVPGEGLPTANFSANNTSICPGQTIQFNNQSTGDISSYSWTFSGGTPTTSSMPNPVITYNNAGTYNVALTVTNTNGSNTSTQNNYIIVNPAPTAPTIVQNGNVLSVFLMIGETATWFLNGSNVGNGGSITIDTPGNYTVEVINQFGCRANSNMFNVLSTPENVTNPIIIYPNPSNGSFHISMHKIEQFNLKVLDLQGRLVMEQKDIQSNDHTLDMSHLSKGSYVLILSNAEMNSVHRLQLVM